MKEVVMGYNVKPDLADVWSSRVKAAIRESLVETMDEDTRNQIIQQEIEEFTKPRKKGGESKPSLLREMIKEEVRDYFKEAVKEYLDSEGTSGGASVGSWGSEIVSQAAKELLEEHGQLVIRSLMEHVIQFVVDRMRQTFQERTY
jgi:hypothetical protein